MGRPTWDFNTYVPAMLASVSSSVASPDGAASGAQPEKTTIATRSGAARTSGRKVILPVSPEERVGKPTFLKNPADSILLVVPTAIHVVRLRRARRIADERPVG